MFATRYSLLVLCIYFSVISKSISSRAYRVRKINESNFLVTSLPDYDYVSDIGRLPPAAVGRRRMVKLFSVRAQAQEARGGGGGGAGGGRMVAVGGGGARERLWGGALHPARQVSREMINQARDYYFNNLFPHEKNTEPTTCTKRDTLNRNMQVAKKLAAVLLDQNDLQLNSVTYRSVLPEHKGNEDIILEKEIIRGRKSPQSYMLRKPPLRPTV